MATDIGPRIGLSGKSQFTKDLKDVNAQVKTLGTEMSKLSAEFEGQEKSEEALTAKSKLLNEQITKQKEKIDLLSKGLKESATQYGENDAKTQKWQQQLNEAEAQLYKMEHQLEQTNKDLHDEGEEADKAGKETKEAGEDAEKSSKGWDALKTAVASVGAEMAAAAVAAGKAAFELGKAVVQAYSDYEQLSGGVETLFGDASDEVQKFADRAFQTAGMSANEYMETVTGFSASLIQSLEGDTDRAANLADKAIIDMSDNANKMGSDISSLQNAYAGFAKGQYNMLDNLKLGYGGTKSEMERLLKDAEAISGVEYDIDSYADIIEAIHTIQDEMGITGTTAKESSQTVSGSISAMESAYQNLLSGLGRDGAEVQELSQMLIDSFVTVVDNVAPIIGQLAESLPVAITALVSAAMDQLPMLLDTAVELFNAVLTQLVALIPDLVPVIVDAVLTIAQTLIDNLPTIIEGGIQLILALVSGLAEATPQLIPPMIDAILTLVDALIDNLDMLIDAAIQIIVALAGGLIDALPRLLEKAPEIVASLVESIIKAAPKLLDAALQLILKLAEGLVSFFFKIKDKGREIVDEIKGGFDEKLDNAKTWGADLIQNFVDGIKQKWENLKASVQGVAQTVKDFLGFSEPKEGPLSNFHEFAPDMIDLFIRGLRDGQRRLQTQLSETFDPSSLTSSGVADVTVGTAGMMGVTIPLNIDGQLLTRVVAQIMYQQNQAVVRNYGRA